MGVLVGVLGPLVAWIDGRPVDLGGPGERAVLARLAAAQGQVVSADRLVHDLWAGEPGPKALAGLQVRISRLRRVLEPDRPPRAPAEVLVTAAPGYALAAETDADRFTAAITPAAGPTAVRAALALWRGPAYGEVADEPWARTEVTRLDELLLAARERLAAGELDAGGSASVIADLEAHVHAHPLREEGVRLLALALYRAGRGPEALAAVRTARTRLGEELGLDPGPALVELETAILRHDPMLTTPATAPVPEPPVAPAGAAREPVERPVGRDREWGRVMLVADRVAVGREPEIVVASGEAGAGKSTLLSAVSADLVGRGWTAAHGRCPEVDGAPPAWVWSEVAAALGEHVTDGPDEAGTPFLQGRALVSVLRRAAQRSRVLVVLDDLHRADEETLRMLRDVLGSGVPGLLVVAGARPEGRDLLESTFAAVASQVGERIEVGGLDAAGVAALAARDGVTLTASEAADACRRTGGNPLFLREVIRLARRDGVEAARSVVPAGVRDVLRRRVAGLPARARLVLAHAALFGRDVEIDTLLAFERTIAGNDDTAAGARDIDDEVLDVLDLAEATGVVGTADDGRIEFAHDLWREVLYDDLPRLRRARLHVTGIDVLTARSPVASGRVAAALGQHALAAGTRLDPGRALALLEPAAAQAMAGGAHRRAAELWAATRDAARRAELPVERVVALRCRLISALAHAGANQAAHDERDELVTEARGTGDLGLLAAAMSCMDAPTAWTIKVDGGRWTPVVDELVDARRDGRWCPHDADWARFLVSAAEVVEDLEPERADAYGAEALACARRLGDRHLECAALNARLHATASPAFWPQARVVGQELLDVATAIGHPGYRVIGHYGLFSAACTESDPDAAAEHAAAAVAAAGGGQLEMTMTWVASIEACRAVLDGRLSEARERYRAMAARSAAAGVAESRMQAAAGLLVVGHAEGTMAAGLPVMDELGPLYGWRVSDVWARAFLDAGRPEDARRVWRPDVPVPRDQSWVCASTLRAEVAVMLHASDVAARCLADLEPYTGHLTISAHGAIVFAPVDLALARLCRLLGAPVARRHRHLDIAARLTRPDHPWQDQIRAERDLVPNP